MKKETEFFIYLLERYSSYKNIPTNEVLREWDEKNLTQYIYDMYEIYHTERLENAFMDIDSLVATGKPAW